jgi:putative FmdB family regulatory protein
MPIYEYQCKACGHQFDIIQDFSEDPLTDCPVCRKAELNKLISAPAFQLKGTGWYVTDFKDSGKKPTAKTAVESQAANTTENKTDAKKSASTTNKQKTDSSQGEVKS